MTTDAEQVTPERLAEIERAERIVGAQGRTFSLVGSDAHDMVAALRTAWADLDRLRALLAEALRIVPSSYEREWRDAATAAVADHGPDVDERDVCVCGLEPASADGCSLR